MQDSVLTDFTEMRPCSDKKTGKEEVLVWQEEGQQLAERGAAVDVVKNIANRIWDDSQGKTAHQVETRNWRQLQGTGRMACWLPTLEYPVPPTEGIALRQRRPRQSYSGRDVGLHRMRRMNT